MPAPTALVRAPEQFAEAQAAASLDYSAIASMDTMTPDTSIPSTSTDTTNTDDAMHIDTEGRPTFAPEKDGNIVHRAEARKVPVPPHRMTPLKASWPKIYPPLVEHLKLQVRMNVKSRSVELRTSCLLYTSPSPRD